MARIVGKTELIRSLRTRYRLEAHRRAAGYYEIVLRATLALRMNTLTEDQLNTLQDVLATIESLAERGIHAQSLDLDGVDLTSAAGKLQLTVLAAVAAFERDRIRERAKEGLARTNKKGGRPIATETSKLVIKAKNEGMTQSQASKSLGLSLPTIKRHWNKVGA